MKKGELSFQMIVVAIIVLVVLVVAVAMFSSKMRWFSKSTNTCTSQGGHCESVTVCRSIGLPIPNVEGCGTGQVCCATLT